MSHPHQQALARVLWIGGATDAGKTTIAKILAERHGWHAYHYDPQSARHLDQAAETSPLIREFLDASIDGRWVHTTPEKLLHFTNCTFRERFPLVVQDLLNLPQPQLIVAEGFGLTPELVAPLLSSKRQAIWLTPTEDFKWASMTRRKKPSFQNEASDPERATMNLFRRDMMIAEQVKDQAKLHNLKWVEVDNGRSIEEIVTRVEVHFAPFLG